MKEINLYLYGKSTVQGKWEFDRNRIVNRLYFVNSGTATILNGSTEYKLVSGKIYIIPQCKNFETISAQSFDHTFFDFYYSRILNPYKIIELDIKELSAEPLLKYINGLLEDDPDKTMASAMEGFLYGLLTLIDSKYTPLPYITSTAITRAINIIHREYRSISTKELSKRLNLNESYFIRLFSSTMGTSPMKYIRAVRISQAKALIHNGTSISEAAEKCGYSSSSALYNATKAEFSLPPSKLK